MPGMVKRVISEVSGSRDVVEQWPGAAGQAMASRRLHYLVVIPTELSPNALTDLPDYPIPLQDA
jgi:hypothetical protein